MTPAGVGENIRRARGDAKQPVHLAVGQVDKINSRLFDHAAKLARGQHGVHVALAARVHFGPLRLELLGRARHHRHHVNVLRFFAGFLRPVRFCHRAEHLLRRFAGRKIGQVFRVEIFHIFDPARRTARELRQGRRLFVAQRQLEAREQFHAFFDDGQVGGEIGVEDRARTPAAAGPRPSSRSPACPPEGRNIRRARRGPPARSARPRFSSGHRALSRRARYAVLR